MKLLIYVFVVLVNSIVYCLCQKSVPCVVNPLIEERHQVITCYVEDVEVTEQDNFVLLDKDKNGVTIGNLTNDKIQQVEITRTLMPKLPMQIFEAFENLERLECRGDVERMLPGVFQKAHKLIQLNFNANKLTKLAAYNFKGAENLLDLRLGSNEIEIIDEFAFDGLSKLTNLRLAENKIANLLENTFQSNTGLERVDLTENKLQNLPADLFKQNVKLKRIGLASNEIKSLSNTMFSHLTKLTNIELEDNVCVDKGYDFDDDSEEYDDVVARMETDLEKCAEK